jgi:hypothetical protein
MEDQTRFGFRLMAPGWQAVMGIVGILALTACGGPAWKAGHATKPDERSAGRYCVLDREGEFGGRVINYVDPELCGRHVQVRSRSAVRVPPEIALRNAVSGVRKQLTEAQERARALGERP